METRGQFTHISPNVQGYSRRRWRHTDAAAETMDGMDDVINDTIACDIACSSAGCTFTTGLQISHFRPLYTPSYSAPLLSTNMPSLGIALILLRLIVTSL